MRGAEGAIACILLVTVAAPARAQSAEAEALFREGRTLLAGGDLEAACAKFEASQRLEPSVGTLLNLGDCREQLGQVASAWAAFVEAESLARRRDDEKRAREAQRRATALEPQLAYLTIDVPSDSRIHGLVITRDGEVVDAGAWSTQVPVDPGEYHIEARADGYEPWSIDVRVTPPTRRAAIAVPRLVRLPPPPRTTTVAISSGPSRWTGTRRVAVALGSAGVASIGGGIAFGLRARDLAERSDAICPSEVCADPEGLRLNDDARDNAMRANVFYGVGAAAIAGAITLWVLGAPDEVAPVPIVSADHVGLGIARRF